MRVIARCFALQELTKQGVCPREIVVVDNPHLAHIGGQIADAAGQKFAPDDGVDAL